MPDQWKQKQSTIRHYDQTAPAYDRQYREEQEAKITATLQNMPLMKDAIVLDTGCGTGLLFSHIAKQAKQIIGIDTSLNLLKQAKTKAKAKTTKNTHIIQADADHQPFKADTFTHTFAYTLVQNAPDPARTLEELKRTAQPNATIVITGLKKHYTLENFTQLLANARFEIKALKTEEKLKDYVAICQNT
jgi:ubiquinone/menaquinone biosynthesis C-methylase UbiE